MQENNKLVQEALIQMKQVEEAIAENAKGILASTMKEEINQLVKESLSEQEEDEVELDVDMDDEMDSDEEEMDFDMDTDNEDEDEMDMDFDMDMDSDESPIDLTGASDEEILRVFKAMGEEDGIIVQKDGEDIHLTDNDNDSEYIVKLGESEDEDELLDEEDDMEFDFEELGEMDDQTTDDVLDAIFADGDADDIELDQDEEEVMFEIEFEDDEEEEFIDEEEDDDMMDEQYDDEEDEDDDMMDEQYDDEEDDDMMDEEEDLEESYNRRRTVRESKSTIKPKGVGIGSGPKFTYKDKASGGFNEKRKEGPKSVGTGKAKFDYKKGENMEGSSKVVKAETKEGAHGMNKGDKSKTMKGKEDYTTKKGDTLKRKAFEKEETKEAARTYGMGSKSGRGLRKGITPNRNIVYKESTQEVTMLREKNEEYRKALNVFREKLNEVAIFNSNLAYATRLFTEHSTTKKEKINILRRFDDVETLKESKNLYQSIKGELSKPEIKKSISESVENKLQKTVSTGSSTTLIESKTYENPQFMRMKDLMSKLG
jgi:hypothetical protein